jgi:hypothetical protein
MELGQVKCFEEPSIPPFKELKIIEIENCLIDYLADEESQNLLNIDCLDDGSFVIAYPNTEKCTSIVIIEECEGDGCKKCGEKYRVKSHIVDSDLEFWSLSITIHGNKILVDTQSIMKVFNYELKPECDLKLESLEFDLIKSVTANETTIFCLEKDRVIRLNWKLELIDICFLQTTEPDAPFYLADNAKQIFVHETRFFCRHGTKMRIIDLPTGNLIREFDVFDNEFKVDVRNEFIIAKSQDNKEISYLNFEGDVVYNHKLDGYPDNSDDLEFFFDNDGRLFFYLSHNISSKVCLYHI